MLSVTCSRSGNCPASGLVTEQPQYYVVICIFSIWQNTETMLISNGLRLIFFCLLFLAQPISFQQLSSPNIPSVKIANGSLSRPPGPNYEPKPYRKFDRANSPSYPNLVLPPKNRPGRSSDLMANQTVRSCIKKAVEKSTAFYIGMNRPLIRQEQRPAQAADRKPEVPPAEPQERDLRRSSSPSAHWHLSRVPRCCEPPDRDP